MEKLNSRKLSDAEKKMLADCETVTDQFINNWDGYSNICIDADRLRDLGKNEINRRRKDIVVDIWKEKYEEAGWRVYQISTGEYVLTHPERE